MGQLHSLGFSALAFGAVFVGAFLYFLGLSWLQNIGVRHFQAKRYAEAAEAFQRVLKFRPPGGIEADTRRRLADTLDVLGQTEGAVAERDRAAAIIARNPEDPQALQAHGDLLKRKQQYNEACAAYSQALAKTPALDAPGRALIMSKLALAHHEAARPAETVRWAQAALASRPAAEIGIVMERMCGVGYADQGDLEKAEQHYRRALELSEQSRNPKQIAQSLGILAGIHYKRGQFSEAIAAAHQAREAFTDPSQVSFAIEAECLRDMGRFDEARTVMAQRRRAKGFDEPWTARRMQALSALGSAWIEIFADCPAAALPYLEEAREGLKVAAGATDWPPPPSSGEDKVMIWCDAAFAASLAGTGRDNEARQLVSSIRKRLLYFGQDRATQLGALGSLGRAAFALGDLAESRDFWLQYLDCKPNPVSVPNACYHLGEIYLRLAETAAARELFQQALAPGVDSFYARRAKARLAEIGG